MIKFAKYLFIIFPFTIILPLVCLFLFSNYKIRKMELDTSYKILDSVSREINYNIENNLKIKTVDAMEALYIPTTEKYTKEKIINTFKDSKVEFLDTFPEKIIYYYKVENSPQPKLYSVIIIPFLEDDIKGIKITKEAVPSSLKLPGPFFAEFYSGNIISEDKLISIIAPKENIKILPGFKKNLSSIPLGIPKDKNIAYKIFKIDKNYASDDITILIKTSWHIPPANPYERRAGLVIILAGVLLSIYVTRYINLNFINPFIKLSAAANRVKSGDLNLVLKTNTKQKTVQETCANFNDMVKGLKEKEELRAGFIRNLTHDLRTPLIAQERALSMISGKFSELNLDEEKELAKSLEKNTSHLLRMVNLILESYQFNLKNEDLNFEKINITKAVNDCFIKIKPIADDKNISLINKTDNEDICTDITCFERIIINLCANAIENLQKGGYVQISAEKSDAEVKIIVEDNGNGISKEDIEHIFDRYFSSKSYNRKLGSGLGLDVVKRLTDIINGRIELESEISKYTKFTLILPRHKERA